MITTAKTRWPIATSGRRLYDLLLRRPKLVPVVSGLAVALMVLLAGLLLKGTHESPWPWWFHGVFIALLTGVFAGLLTRLHIHQAKGRESRLAACELISHEVCNALQVLLQRAYLNPELRVQHEDEAIERIRNVMREILPDVVDIPKGSRPRPGGAPAADDEKLRHKAASNHS